MTSGNLEVIQWREERETANEEKDAHNLQENLDFISADEEDSQIESREAEINPDIAILLTSSREHLDSYVASASEGEEVSQITRESGDDDDDEEHPSPRNHSLSAHLGGSVDFII
ncbi:uncharacterized protein N7511_011507 [Penicillium nucicola]|uniref:uncharacterized protein n=1 Tax=Penicillium nucicola TaxID=1850975 RepID=UPI002545A35C|nr:uncharacterized protein N7511_011507 [Penicillium nucicola]KAJ5742488.1 hypothetical protein N7511_011507 [Penicillium nucicola]